MSWLSQASHTAINANLTNLEGVYQSVKASIQSGNNGALASQPDDHLRFAFCCFVAFDLKPYIGSAAKSLRDLMNEDGLDCDNYVRLAWYFFQVMRPRYTSEICAVGWEGGPIGNHAQMQIKTAGAPDLYCDPTIGLAVHGVDFDALCTGFQVPPSCLYSIFSTNHRPDVNDLNANTISAMINGSYRASHLLYVYTDMPRYNSLTRESLGTYPVRNEF